MSSGCNVKGPLQVTELQFANFSSKDNTDLILRDNARSNSWVFNNFAIELGLHGTELKLAAIGVNTEEAIDTI